MGKLIDYNVPFTDEVKEYLEARGRGHEIVENERRFPNGDASAADELETAGSDPESASFDPAERQAATHDVGGAALPNTVLSKDTGRVVDFEVRSESDNPDPYVSDPESEPESDEDFEASFDQDIIDDVEAIPNVTAIKKRFEDEKLEFDKGWDKRELQDALIIGLQERRDRAARGDDDSNPLIVNDPQASGGPETEVEPEIESTS